MLKRRDLDCSSSDSDGGIPVANLSGLTGVQERSLEFGLSVTFVLWPQDHVPLGILCKVLRNKLWVIWCLSSQTRFFWLDEHHGCDFSLIMWWPVPGETWSGLATSQRGFLYCGVRLETADSLVLPQKAGFVPSGWRLVLAPWKWFRYYWTFQWAMLKWSLSLEGWMEG